MKNRSTAADTFTVLSMALCRITMQEPIWYFAHVQNAVPSLHYIIPSSLPLFRSVRISPDARVLNLMRQQPEAYDIK